jgi:hypothetical protein
MSRTRHAIRRHSLGHASCAVQLLAGAGLLTLMPSVMAESPFTQALQYAQPLTWVMLAAGAGVLLAQRWLGGRRAPSVGIAESGRDRSCEQSAASATRSSPARLDSGLLRRIPEHGFEAVIEALLERSGYQVRSRSPHPDGGVDVGLAPRGAGEGQAGLLRCRQRAGKTVSIDDIRDLEQAMLEQGAVTGHFATTSLLTPGAIAFARTRGIQLLDVDGILRMAAKLSAADQRALAAAAADDRAVAELRAATEARSAGPARQAGDAAMLARPDAAPASRASVVPLPERFRADRVAA